MRLLRLMFVLLLACPLPAAAYVYQDVSTDHPYYRAIGKLTLIGLLQGNADRLFYPDALINRAEFLKMVLPLRRTEAEIADCSLPQQFSDVPTDAWFAPYVCTAWLSGIVQGYEDGTFHPEQPVTFAEAAKIIIRSINGQTVKTTAEAAWWEPYVLTLRLADAVPQSVAGPDQQLTRGEAAEAFYQLNARLIRQHPLGAPLP